MGSREDARDLMTTMVDAYNARDIPGLMALYHPDATYWSALSGLQEGAGTIRDHLELLHETLPDEHMTTKALMTVGSIVVAEFESTGTSPTGESYRIEFTEVFELVDAKIRSVKVYLDPEEVEAITG